MIKPEDIVAGYRYVLGRDPEPELNLADGCTHFENWAALRDSLFNSTEAISTCYDALLKSRISWIKIPTFFGRQLYICLSDIAVSKQLFLTGRWEPEVEEGIVQRIQRDMVFVDVGANIGWFSLLVADRIVRAGGNGKVVAIEANASIVPFLMASVVESGLAGTISVKPYAVSSESGVIEMPAVPQGNLGGFGISAVGSLSGLERNIIPAIRLDDLLADLTRVDLVKMDIEGAEPLAIEGFSNTLTRLRPDIIMEINVEGLQAIAGRRVEDLVRQMEDLGYSPFDFRRLDRPRTLSTQAICDILGSRGYYDFMFKAASAS